MVCVIQVDVSNIQVCCVEQIFWAAFSAGSLLQHMWAHERQGERISWPAWWWVSVLSTVLATWPHGRNRRWCLGAVWDFIRSLCVSVPRSPRISLFANMLAWISYCVPLSEHVHILVVFFFVHLLAFMYLWMCPCIVLTRNKHPGQTVCNPVSHLPVFNLKVNAE